MKRLLVVAALVLASASVAHAQALVNLQNAARATGNGTAISLNGTMASVAVQVIPTALNVYRVAFEASMDGTNYGLITCYAQGQSSGATSMITTHSAGLAITDRDLWRCNVAGWRYFRARIASITVLSSLSSSQQNLTVKAVAIPQPGFSGGALTP